MNIYHWLLSLAIVIGYYHWLLALAIIIGYYHWLLSLAIIIGYYHWLWRCTGVTVLPVRIGVPVYHELLPL